MAKLRVGAVNYLNTKPLVRTLERLAPEIELILDVPSQLALDLSEGRIDVGLIPSVEYFRAGNYRIVPGVSIASYGPVMSVKVCSKVPFAEIRRMALDEGSRTSIALAEILLSHLFGIAPATQPLPLHVDPLHAKTDAVLVIGDRAMRVRDGSFPFTLDLGYEWSRWTGLPFVFAFWAVAEGVEMSAQTCAAFALAKEQGRPEIPKIAREHAAALGIDEAQARYYLEQVIRHDFGPDEMAGLERFRALAEQRGLIPPGGQCVTYRPKHLVENR